MRRRHGWPVEPPPGAAWPEKIPPGYQPVLDPHDALDYLNACVDRLAPRDDRREFLTLSESFVNAMRPSGLICVSLEFLAWDSEQPKAVVGRFSKWATTVPVAAVVRSHVGPDITGGDFGIGRLFAVITPER